jgi:hypothetical protein
MRAKQIATYEDISLVGSHYADFESRSKRRARLRIKELGLLDGDLVLLMKRDRQYLVVGNKLILFKIT